MKKLSLAALISTLAFAGAAHAAVLSESNLSMTDAQKLATATVAACQAKGYNVSAAVVDRAGLLKAFARADNLTDIPGFLLLGGGVPIKAGNSVIGAIGVAGAPGGNLDAQCADAVLEENAALFK